jgi:hypothetical protein
MFVFSLYIEDGEDVEGEKLAVVVKPKTVGSPPLWTDGTEAHKIALMLNIACFIS